MTTWDLSQECVIGPIFKKPLMKIHHIDRIKEKKYMVISKNILMKKRCRQNQHLLMPKLSTKYKEKRIS